MSSSRRFQRASNKTTTNPNNLLSGKLFSSVTSSVSPLSNITDGDTSTRWISDTVDNVYITADLGDEYQANQFVVVWAGDTTKDYSIQVSSDNTFWTTIYTGLTTNVSPETDTITTFIDNPSGRYVRVQCIDRWNNTYGNSIWEMSAYGSLASTAPQNLTATPSDTSVALTWAAPARLEGTFVGYNVYQGTSRLTGTPITATNYNVSGLTSGDEYIFEVRVVTSSGTSGAVSVDTTTTGTIVVGDPTAVNFTPAIIPLSDPEIPNSGRGQYFWLEQVPSGDPSGWPLVDVYHRPDGAWKTIETSPGVYNWSIVDSALAEAATMGGRLQWRTMPWYDSGHAAEAPSWIPTAGSDGAPDWNSSTYINDWCNMVTAMGARYDSNPRFWAYDISAFGSWGEGGSSVAADMTDANMTTIIQATKAAFPNTFVMSAAMGPAWTNMPIIYGTSGKWGSYYDFLGGQELSYSGLGGTAQAPLVTQWQRGPFRTEWDPIVDSFSVSIGWDNVQSLHVSMLSSGNKPTGHLYANMSPSDQALYLQANKLAGFRYVCQSANMYTNVGRGSSTSVTTTWQNLGVAPIYDNCTIKLVLTGTDSVKRYVNLNDNLKQILGSNATAAFTTNYTMPSALPAGSVQVGITVQYNDGLLAPVRIANTGRTTDGVYPLGTITVA